MPIVSARAPEALLSLSAILAREKDTLSAEVRRRIEELIRRYAPRIAAAGAWGEDPMQRFLEEIWPLRNELPEEAREALSSAWRVTGGPVMRSSVGVPEDKRRAILANLRQIVDYRVFVDPPALQAKVSALIRQYQDRLTETERQGWHDLEKTFESDGDAEAYLRWVEAHLWGYPAVMQLLEEGKADAPKPKPPGFTERGGGVKGVPGPTSVRPMAADAGLPSAEPATVDRYGNVYFPEQVMVRQRVPLIVHVARQLSAAAGQRIPAEHARMSLATGPLTLVLNAEGFQVDDFAIGGEAVPGRPRARTVHVKREADCEPVIFFLTAEAAGPKRVSVDVYQYGRNIRTLAFTVDVVAEGTAITRLGNVEYDNTIPIMSALAGPDAPPPDLELRVMLSGDGRTLIYTLHSPRPPRDGPSYNFQEAGQVTLTSEPARYFRARYDRLSDLARLLEEDRSPAETEAARQEIADMGVALYEELFSPELKKAYRDFREAYAGKSLLITSDDPWVPWELVRPMEVDNTGNVLYEDPPLCERFKLARWLAGRGAPDRVGMKRGVWVTPPSNLGEVAVERAYFEELHRRRWEITFSGPLRRVSEVESEFRAGQAELFHFSCHGGFDDSDPNESALELADREYLRPSTIVGQKKAGLLRARPLVFLNACHGGRVGIALTGLGGWAQRFLDSGASAFIGSLWEINDRLAAQFAVEFYNRLWGLGGCQKMPLGEAFHQARLAIRDADPANPTWLAYVLYGDPYGQVVLGAV